MSYIIGAREDTSLDYVSYSPSSSMQPLYKRLLLTLFPDAMKNADINPATMFISSLSAKEFFSLLSRKVTEYYKINGFDTGLETFEAKIGLGKEQGISVHKANDYYGYLIAAQYPGSGFFSPSFVSTHVALYSSTLLAPLFAQASDLSESSFTHTVTALYLMPLLFVTHIKQFSHTMDHKQQYNWFVELFLALIRFVADDSDDSDIHTINHILNHESTVLRTLFVVCQHATSLFPIDASDADTYRDWMLNQRLFDHDNDTISSFVQQYNQQSCLPSIHAYEQEVMLMLFPHDVSINNLYKDVRFIDVVQHIVTPWYQAHETLQDDRKQLSEDATMRHRILHDFSDVTYDKKAFWSGIQSFIMHHRTTQDIDIHEDIDDFMSSIENGHHVDMNRVPDSIKHESRLVDQIVHFYIGMVGGHRGSKNDNFRYRRTNRERHTHHEIRTMKHDTHAIHDYRQQHFALYDTNSFYYQRAWEHIRQGKQKFHIPLNASIGHDTNDDYIADQVVCSSIFSLLNTTHNKRMKLTIHQNDMVDLFARHYADRIRSHIDDGEHSTHHDRHLIDQYTGHTWSDTFSTIVHNHDDIGRPLTDSLYRLDQWLWRDILQQIINHDMLLASLHTLYDDSTLLVTASELNKTLFGVMLRIAYEDKHHQSRGTKLRDVYIHHVLHVDASLWPGLHQLLDSIYQEYADLLSLWIQLDDNESFLDICSTIWHEFHHTTYNLTKEDILWLHSVFSHINAYNTRYIIPEGV